eukprot:scaffold276288_cov21-Tisochrysis_lutea.AAC.1
MSFPLCALAGFLCSEACFLTLLACKSHGINLCLIGQTGRHHPVTKKTEGSHKNFLIQNFPIFLKLEPSGVTRDINVQESSSSADDVITGGPCLLRGCCWTQRTKALRLKRERGGKWSWSAQAVQRRNPA